ncbi:hypothetical protein NDN08_007050 [Rhodosorus marinus]|uniref:Uncharacterized protein n=1 Tax=Rhodosorus marinus TaxID=101924 RepID=A0AAV8UIE3_9RHOD|nr:hypothetical protein NDN08_007050 [Rhodosorus marinus]
MAAGVSAEDLAKLNQMGNTMRPPVAAYQPRQLPQRQQAQMLQGQIPLQQQPQQPQHAQQPQQPQQQPTQPHQQPQQQPTPELSRNNSQRIWSGLLTVRSSEKVLNVQCIAKRQSIDSAAPVRDSVGWPRVLTCGAERLNQFEDLKPRATSELSQWYVVFVPIDEQTQQEITHPLLTDLVKLMFERKLAFEINCDDHPTKKGSLILFGSNLEGGHKLIGVYVQRPSGGGPQ